MATSTTASYSEEQEHTIGVYGRWQILSMTTTIAMIVAASTPGRTTRLNTSSPSVVTCLLDDATPAFFLEIRATSLPSLRRILQLLLQKQPSIWKLGTASPWCLQLRLDDDDAAALVDAMWTSAWSLVLLFSAEVLCMVKTSCGGVEEDCFLPVQGHSSVAV